MRSLLPGRLSLGGQPPRGARRSRRRRGRARAGPRPARRRRRRTARATWPSTAPTAPRGARRGRGVFAAAPPRTRRPRRATLVLRDLRPAGDLTRAPRQAERFLARPTDDAADQLGDGSGPSTTPVVTQRRRLRALGRHHLRPGAVQGDADDNDVPDYVDDAGDDRRGAPTLRRRRLPRAQARRRPAAATHRTDVYLADVGAEGLYGYCTSDEAIPANGRFDSGPTACSTTTTAASSRPTPPENMQVTAAHEYFHAVQFAYDAFEDGWFMEATATWAEDEVFDGVDDNVQYLPAGPLGRPRVPLDKFATAPPVRRLDLLPLPHRALPRPAAGCRPWSATCGTGPTAPPAAATMYSLQAVGPCCGRAARRSAPDLRQVRRRQPPAPADVRRGRRQPLPPAPLSAPGPHARRPASPGDGSTTRPPPRSVRPAGP